MGPEESESWIIRRSVAMLKWCIDNGKVDPLLRIVFGILFWTILIYAGQFLAYRQIQIELFEIPPDRLLSQTNNFELFQSLILFPLNLILAPTGIVFIMPFLRFFSEQAEKYEKIKGRRWLSAVFHSLILIFWVAMVPVYRWFYSSSTDYAFFIFVSVTFFGVALYFLNLIFVYSVENPSGNKSKSIGRLLLLALLGCVLFLGSFIAMVRAQTKEDQSKKFRADICKNITFVAVNVGEKFRPGWLISRDSSATLIRELNNNVYRTIEIKTEDIKEFIYMKRFGSDNEKNHAFPACSDSI